MPDPRITRRRFIQEAGVGAAALAMLPRLTACAAPRASRPNILFIMSDDHAYQAISAYGGGLNVTPSIDRLAEEGVRFTRSFVTNSICGPSRAVLLTGKYSHVNGFKDNYSSFDGAQETFPKILQRAGYATAVFGKWHLESDPTGFDYWNILPGQGHYYNPDFIRMGQTVQRHGYVTDLITDDCLDWLANRDLDKPFCALLHHKAPHRNWMPNLPHLALYQDEVIPEPETLFDDYATRSEAARTQIMNVGSDLTLSYDLKVDPETTTQLAPDELHRDLWLEHYGRLDEEQKRTWDEAYRARSEEVLRLNPQGDDLTRWKYQQYLKDYLRCIASVDENVGRVMDFLEDAGLAEDTVVVYTSDQGFYLGEHGWFDKRFMYEESLRMPLIVRFPAEIAPRVADDMVLNLDFAPTFLDYAGVPIPAEMQGESMRPVLAGRTPPDWGRSVYYHYYEYPGSPLIKRHYGVRTERYKLIRFYFDIEAWELYDLEKDPQELHNVYDDPSYAAVVVEMKAELERLRIQYGDTEG
ncbi:MAG TPA: sulfatase [Longimicrobiales bacterium]|nr:sulfatase [Longimicrobiales bacterium]